MRTGLCALRKTHVGGKRFGRERPMPLGDRLRQARQQSGLTQADLAGKVGVSQGTISHWENGKLEPSKNQTAGLVKILGPAVGPEGKTEAIRGPLLIGKRLLEMREAAGLTPAELAGKADISVGQVYNIETGRTQYPRQQTIKKLEGALGKKFDAEVSEQLKSESRIEGLGDFKDFDPHDSKDWPDDPGVYVFYDISERPIYVGQSGKISRRLKSHEQHFWYKHPIVDTSSYVRIENETLRRQIESILIKFLKSNAVLNRQQVDRDE